MSNQLFPKLAGLGWPVGRKPIFSTVISKSAGGQEVRIPNYPYPLEEFDLTINYLHQGNSPYAPGNVADYQQLSGFFQARLGPWDSFLYQDPSDNFTETNAAYEGLIPNTGQNVIATGDGATDAFQLMRGIGGAMQPIYDINGIAATLSPPISSPFVIVYVGGSIVTSGWSVNATGLLTFSVAPGSGQAIAADFSYFRRVRFRGDDLEFENFMSNLWRAKKIPLQVVPA